MDSLIENVAYKSTDGNLVNENFDPTLLESKFRHAMSILQVNDIHISLSLLTSHQFFKEKD